MRRFLGRSILILGTVVFTSLAAEGMVPSKPLLTPLGQAGDILMANRLRGRASFRVRPSRYRVAAFARGQDCPAEAQKGFQPIVPKLGEQVAAVAKSDAANRAGVEVGFPGQATSPTIPTYLSASAHPVFLINVPAMPGAIGTLFIEIPDKPLTERQQYKVDFDLPNQAGVIGISIPTTAPSLQAGPVYLWRVSVECSPSDQSLDVVGVQGAAFEQVPEVDGTPEERLNYYLEKGIWQDTAAMLAANRFSDASAESDEEWATLMEASGLPQFAHTPIISIQEGRLATE